MKKILLAHGYFMYEDAKELKIMRPYPPLGILYISAYLEKHGIPTHVFDTTFSSKEEFFQYLDTEKPEIIALYTNLMTKVNIIRIIKHIRNSPALAKTTIILGGPDITYNVENYLKAGADILVIGEGEETMLELVTVLQSNPKSSLKDISGLAFKDDNGELVRTPARTKIRDIDELTFPNRAAIDLSKYLETWKKHHGKSAINVSTQRGCPYTCKWCSTAVYGQSYRRRSPELVVEELAYLKETYNPDTIWFVDDVFTVSHKWLAAFEEALDKKQIRVPFECISRADRLNPEIIKTLKRSGCFRIWIGAESGSQAIIDAMDRRVSVDQVRNMIVEARKEGIETGTFIMLGYPGETEHDIEETIHHLKVSNPDHFTITVAYPIKGTSLYSQVESTKVAPPDWETSTDRDIDFKRSYSRKYYDYAVTWVVSEVHHHKHALGSGSAFKTLKLKTKSMMAKMGMRLERMRSDPS